jgi:DUF1680 family protein
VTFTVTTEYPWEGRVVVTMVGSTTTGAWDLALRVPQWAPGLVATLNGDPIEPVVTAGWLTVHSNWIAGDQVIVDLLLTPQFIQADARVDADRGALALQRGPLVYCLEAADNQNCLLDDVVVDPGAGTQVVDADPALGPVAAIRLRGSVRPAHDRPWWPYRTLEAGPAEPGEDTAFTAVPYFAWGNRGPGAMRVWLPYL